MLDQIRLPIVTVIVPVYNIEGLIDACLRSLVAQDYQNIEIIVVDDGSTDRSNEVIRGFEEADQRIRVITKKNGGLSDARNAGIRVARGEYITCVDGDDFVYPTYVSTLIQPLLEGRADISSAGFERVLEDTKPRVRHRSPVAQFSYWSREKALENLFLQRKVTTSAWGKMYRASLFQGVEYPVGAIHEDLPVTYRLFARSRFVAQTDSIEYCYVQRRGSITGTADYHRRLEAISFAQEAVEFANNGELPSVVAASRARALMECAYVVTQVPNLLALATLDPVVMRVVSTNRGAVLRSATVPLKQRVIALSTYFGLTWTWLFMRLAVLASNVRTRRRSIR